MQKRRPTKSSRPEDTRVVTPDKFSVDKDSKTDDLRITVNKNSNLSVVQGKRAKQTVVSVENNCVYIQPKSKLFWTTSEVIVKDRDGNSVKVASEKGVYRFAAVSGASYYVTVVHRFGFIFLLLFGLLAASCILVPAVLSDPSDPAEPVDRTPQGTFVVGGKREEPIPEPTEKDVPTITFSGYGRFTVSKKKTDVEFSNPANNFVNMQFTLIDDLTGDVVARTGLVPPGNYVYVNVMEYYKDQKGEFSTSVQIDTFTNDGRQMNGMAEKMVLVIE